MAITAFARRKLAGLAPPPEVQLSLVIQNFTYSVGTGFYVAGSAIFFTTYVGLTSGQIAFGVSAAAFATFVLRIPIGMLADRLGGLTMWRIGALAQAVLFGAYPFVHSFTFFLVVMVAVGLFASAGESGRSRYIGEVISRQAMVRVNSYLRSVINIGLALGTVAAGALIQVQSRQVLVAVVLLNALSFLLDVVFLSIFIKPAPGTNRARRRTRGRRSALADRPFVALSAFRGIFILSDLLLVAVIPLWILQSAHLPHAMIPTILVLNMVMVTVLQARAGRGVENAADSARCQRKAGVLLGAGCAIIPLGAHTAGVWTWVVVLAGAALITQAEMYTAVAGWGLSYGLSPQERLGEYLAVFAMGGQIAVIAGPVVLIPLVTTTSAGWYILSAVFLVAGLASVHLVKIVVRSRSTVGVETE